MDSKASDAARRAELERQVRRRRTFAIISHPDAGKTTLTEKLLLYAGMVRTAGMVKGRKTGRSATSDWMTMEQERGISITASAMQFVYRDHVINILDTPGHQDFSEDTYRTLAAADSVIMVLDAAKGVETQTRKLFDAARLRNIPVFTFINKWDMPGREPLDLMAEVEEILGIAASPMNWPIGRDKTFRGVVDLATRQMHLYTKTSAAGATIPDLTLADLNSDDAAQHLEADELELLREEVELMLEAGNPFEHDAFLRNEVTPVYFGSALTNFGVEHLYDAFLDLAPPPGPRHATDRDGNDLSIAPDDPHFSAFVFKIQANMDPRHRDCVAFLRINSGRYHDDLQVHVGLDARKMRLPRPHSLVVNDRS
ncbi:MAG: peptide chain release factor 3, partial [Candidatus Dadabacteria bacterium]